MHLAPEYEYRVKQLMKAYKISLKHVPGPQINQHKPLDVFEAMEHVLN